MQSHNKPYEGFFITLEGGDGCGKSTLTNLLKTDLEKRGYLVITTYEPGGTPLSEHIRTLLLHPDPTISIAPWSEVLLFLAARAQHLEEKIFPALREGKIVLCERFNDSTIAYQGYARYLGAQAVENICHLATQCIEPDLTFLLDIDPQVGLERLKEKKSLDRLEQEELQFHKEVRNAYLHLADQYPQRIFVLDGSLPINEVFQNAIQALEPHLMLKPHK